MKKLFAAALAALLAIGGFVSAQTIGPTNTGVAASITALPVPQSQGGTGATSLGCGLTNANSTLNTAECPPRAGVATTDSINCVNDNGKVIKYSSTSTVQVPAASSNGCTQGFAVEIDNNSTGPVVLNFTTSTFLGQSSINIPPNSGCSFSSDSTNYNPFNGSCKAYATLSIDGTTNSTSNSSNVVTGSITTTKTNDVIVVIAKAASTCTGTSTVSDTASLTWTKRITQGITGRCNEEWYALSPGILTSDSITYTFNAGMSANGMTIFGVNGANLQIPFDSNNTFPAGVGVTASPGVSAQIFTNSPYTFVVSSIQINNSPGTVTVPPNSVAINSANANQIYYNLFSARQSYASPAYGYSWTGGNIGSPLTVDAIQAAAVGW